METLLMLLIGAVIITIIAAGVFACYLFYRVMKEMNRQ